MLQFPFFRKTLQIQTPSCDMLSLATNATVEYSTTLSYLDIEGRGVDALAAEFSSTWRSFSALLNLA